MRGDRRNGLRRRAHRAHELFDHGGLEGLKAENAAEHDRDREQHDHHALGHGCASVLMPCAPATKSVVVIASGSSGLSGLVSTSILFHQPPPSAWNKAAVSAKRAACACTTASRACA